MKFKELPNGAHLKAGRYDNAGRWYPHEDFVCPGTFDVRSPTRRWPYSYLKHFYTQAYAKTLARNNPALYLELAKIDEHSDRAKEVISWATAQRLK